MPDLLEGLSEKERAAWRDDLEFGCDESLEGRVAKAAGLRPADRRRVVGILRLVDGLASKAAAFPVLLDALGDLGLLWGVPKEVTYASGEARERVERAIGEAVAKSGGTRGEASEIVLKQLGADPALHEAYRRDILFGRVAERQDETG